jgi:hypothetical protein
MALCLSPEAAQSRSGTRAEVRVVLPAQAGSTGPTSGLVPAIVSRDTELKSANNQSANSGSAELGR